MALFLWWARERGLASIDHEDEDFGAAPTQYFIDNCDTKLTDEDLSAQGNAFAEVAYDDYLGEVSAYADTLGVGDYELAEDHATRDHFFAWLDGRLASWRQSRN